MCVLVRACFVRMQALASTCVFVSVRTGVSVCAYAGACVCGRACVCASVGGLAHVRVCVRARKYECMIDHI